MKRPLLTVPAMCVLLASCQKEHYTADAVSITAEGYTVHGIELRFVPPPESIYYCPGLDLDYEGDKVRYSYVRSHIDRTPKIDAKVDYRDGESVVVIPFPPDEDRIELIAPSGKSHGAWQISPSE